MPVAVEPTETEDDADLEAAFAELQRLLDARFAQGPIRMSCCHRPMRCRGCPRYRL
jgi:hypothetical protein